MDKEYIKRLIHFQAPEAVIKRGKALYKNGKTSLISIDQKNDVANFEVRGGQLYKVRINNFNIKDITASCTCPYDWNTLCKHSVASLLHLADAEIEEHAKPKQPKKVRTFAKEPIEINGWQDLNPKKLDIEVYDIPGIYRTGKYLPDLVETSETRLVFKIRHSYAYDKQLVYFEYSNDRVLCSSNSSSHYIQGFTDSEEYCLLSLMENGFPFVFKYFFGGEFNLEKKKIIDMYDLQKNINFNDYFAVDFYDGEIRFYAHKKGIGLICPTSNPYTTQVIKSLSKSYHQTPQENKTLRQIGFAIRMGDVYKDENEFSIDILKGQPNKSNTVLSTHIDFYSNLKNNEICKPNTQQNRIIELIDLIDENDDAYLNNYFEADNTGLEDSMSSNKYRNAHQEYLIALQQLFELLSKEKYVYLNNSNNDFKIKKKDLSSIHIIPNPLDIRIDISKQGKNIHVNPVFKIEGKTIELNQRDEENSCFYTTKINNDLFVYSNLNTCVYLDHFEYPIQTSEKYFDFLYNEVVLPLSKQFHIDVSEDILKKNEHYPEVDLRQLYVSEENEYLRFDPVVVYAYGQSHFLFDRGNQLELKNDELIESKRDENFENSYLEFLSSLHPEFENQKFNRYFHLSFNEVMHQMWFYGFYEKLQKENIQVFGINELEKFKYSPFKAKVNTSISSGQDWFELDIQVQFGNYQIKISDLKKAVINQQQFIQLKNGTVGILPEKWLERFQSYFRNAQVNDEKLQISKLRFNIVDELYENIDNEQILKEISEKKNRLQNIGEIEEVKVPRGIKAQLRSYQKEGLQWLSFLDSMGWGGILADDMGLGKTLQILSFLKHRLTKASKPAIIIVPTTLLFNWENEISKFAPGLKAYYHYGLNRSKNTDGFKKHHLVFTSYGVLVRDIKMLKDYEFSYAILDESQAIKNPLSQRYKAALLIKAQNKFAITGTPIENSTFDLYAQMNFVNPGFFGDIKSFKENYSNRIDKDGNMEISRELQKLSKPFILRRTKEKVASELPAKTEDILFCEMEEEQRKVYEAYRNEYRDKILKKIEDEGIGKSKLYVLEGLLRLRQICDSPALLKETSIPSNQSVKIKELIGFITQKTAKHKLLIFSQFVGMLHLIREELNKLHIDYEYLDGKSSNKDRENSVNHFQSNNNIRVFLVSLKAGGTGLNLTSADYVFLVDPWWNPAVEAQAIDRTHRIGQDKKVFAYRMICKNTIEEKVLKLQSKKKKIAEDIIQTDESVLKSMKSEDIRELFS